MINANQIVMDSQKQAKAYMQAERKKLIYKLLDYYSGDNTEQYISGRFSAKAYQEVPLSSFNVTKRMIDRMSRIYTLGASRSLSAMDDKYQLMTVNKDYRLKHIEKMTRLLGTVATQISFNADNNEFYYNPVYAFDVEMSEYDQHVVESITFPMLTASHDIASNDKLLYCYMDSNIKQIRDEDGVIISEEVNPYGFLPFAFSHRDHYLDSFFCAPAYDIINCNEQINILLTEANLGMRFQMFGQYVVTGMYADESYKRAGSDEMIVLPEGANLSIEAPKVNVEQALKLARNMLELVAQNNHLSISFADTNKDRPSSGIALKIKDLERHEDYQDDLEIWRRFENNLYNIERQIAMFSGVMLPDKIGIDFNEPEYPQAVADQIAMDTWMLENDLTTKAQLLQQRNKDLSIEQAEGIIKENTEKNGAGKTNEAGAGAGQSIFSRLRGGTPEA
jgi:hypothetical protein